MNLNAVLTQAIAKGALSVTRKPIGSLRKNVADLKRQVTELKRLVRDLRKEVGRGSAQAPVREPEAGETPRIRPTGPMVRKLRSRLGLTQVELAKLIGVSSLTVSKWESAEGRIMLRNRTLEALATVRGMGKQAAQKKLAAG
jgi:DNA-binding transcriptional regulator YiaG